MKNPNSQVVIIGGGITGLSTAYYLLQESKETPISITILEASSRIGGKIRTEIQSGFILEAGADSLFTQKPGGIELCKELGLISELVIPLSKNFFIYQKGDFVPVSPGVLSADTEEIFDLEDESIASYLRRKWGQEYSRSTIEPIFEGIYAGNAESLSRDMLLPKQPKKASESDLNIKSSFVSIKGGMQSLVKALENKLSSVIISCSSPVVEIKKTPKLGLEVLCENQELIPAQRIVLTTPAHESAKILDSLQPALSSLLSEIKFASTASIHIAYRKIDISRTLDGTGFLVPRSEALPITACTFVSQKWSDRSPQEIVLLRVFIGAWGEEKMVTSFSDEDLIQEAHLSLQSLLGISSLPLFSKVHRWTLAMPQYEVGHAKRLEKIETLRYEHPEIFLAGASYRGLGIPDCISQGKETAKKIMASLGV